MAEDLGALLDAYQASVLQSIAATADIDVSDRGRSLSKAALISRLRVELFSEGRVRAAWRDLDERERAIVNRLLLHGGEASTRAFKRELYRAGLVTVAPSGFGDVYVAYARGYTGHPKRTHSTAFEDVMARLTQRGIVFSRPANQNWSGTPYKLEFHPGVAVLVPEAVRRFLPEPEPIPLTLSDWEPRRVDAGAPDLLMRDLYLYWDYARRAEVTVIQSGLVGKRWLRAINDLLLAPDAALEEARREDEAPRLFLLRQLAQGLGILELRDGALRPSGDPATIPALWAMSPVVQRAACVDLWPRLEEPRDAAHDENLLPLAADGKRALLKALAGVPAGQWLTPEELLDRAASVANGSLLQGGGFADSYYGYGINENMLLERESAAELSAIIESLRGFLLEIGLVELGHDDDERPRGARVTAEGRAMLRQVESGRGVAAPAASSGSEIGDGASVVVQPNFQVLAIGPVSLATLAWLDLFAERQRAGPAAFEYHLSRESVYAAQQVGVSVGQIQAFLQRVAGSELPQNVARSLGEWAAHHERIVFRDGVSLVQAADAALMERLAQDPQFRRLDLRPLAPDVALLRRDQQDAFVAALLERGLLPAVSDMRPESADNSVVVDAEGVVRTVHAVPSIYLRDRLARFAEPAGDGRWRLTPRAIGRAGGSKGKVARLLEELGALQRGDLPEELVESIRVWGGYYGSAAVETLTLIEFSDHETLTDLLTRPDLRGALIPLSPGKGKRALAAIAEGRREQVEDVLQRLGVRIGGSIAR